MTRLSQTSVPRNRASVFFVFCFFCQCQFERSDVCVVCLFLFKEHTVIFIRELAVTTSVSLVVSKGLGVAPVSAPEHFAVIKGLLLSQ